MVTDISVAEFFVEVHHTRGNVELFEMFNPFTGKWQELDVWEYRRVEDEFWVKAQTIENAIMENENSSGKTPQKMLRATRFPELERDMVDATYHPSVPSWKIDLTTVKERLNG